jgi:hypothetical protein
MLEAVTHVILSALQTVTYHFVRHTACVSLTMLSARAHTHTHARTHAHTHTHCTVYSVG